MFCGKSSLNYPCYPFLLPLLIGAGPRSAVDRAPDSFKSEYLGSIPGLATLSFLLPLIQEGQLSVTGESMCTKYWLTP